MSETLARMIVGASTDAGGHLVLADWLEEHLGRDDLAAVLRLSTADPRTTEGKPKTNFYQFRYELVDADVMLCMAQWRVHQPYLPGGQAKAGPEPEGHLVGLCVSAEAAGQLIRWVRWLPTKGKPTAEVLALWERLGESLPKPPEVESR
jgi:hypothetical protein